MKTKHAARFLKKAQRAHVMSCLSKGLAVVLTAVLLIELLPLGAITAYADDVSQELQVEQPYVEQGGVPA